MLIVLNGSRFYSENSNEETEYIEERSDETQEDGFPFGCGASYGAGVTIYGIGLCSPFIRMDAHTYAPYDIVDTGIYTAHNEFGGRASWGATFGGYASKDGNG